MKQITSQHANRSQSREREARTNDISGQQHCPVVGIGASAGGIEALIRLFGAMPADCGMAFLIVMHIDPTRKSGLTDLFAEHTTMSVVEATDGMAIEPDHVYVIPPAVSLAVEDVHLRLTEPAERHGVRYPIDRLFESLAIHRRARAICMILSGAGSDGTEGLKEVKANGGCILVQDPLTARFDSMPRSAIAADLADRVLAPEDMPTVLMHYISHSYLAKSDFLETELSGENAIEPVLALLRHRNGHDFSNYKRNTLTRRIHRRMGLSNLHAVADYLALLRSRPDEVATLARDLMINVTGFFRDPEAWQMLDRMVLAPLVDARESDAEIRVWVPACATGEEAYTLAMLILDRAEAAGKHFHIKLFASDSRDDNLETARAGTYPQAAVATLPPHIVEKHFEKRDGAYRVKDELRDMIVFASHNLLRDPPFSKIDLVSCRNLLIYLDPVAQKRALALMHFALRPGGYLFLGNAESVSGSEDLYKTVSKKWRIFRQNGPFRHDLLDFPQLPGRTRLNKNEDSFVPDTNRPQQRLIDVAQRALLDRFAPASVLIERGGQVVWVHGSTGAYLEPPPGEPTRDILAMARSGLRGKLRQALRQSIKENRQIDFRVSLMQSDKKKAVAVTVSPHEDPSANLLLISFSDIETASIAEEPAENDDSDITQEAFEIELAMIRAELEDTIEQFERTNEELKAANEEVTSMNEEFQSTNEELETSKEELQSFNEELQTVNSQLQYKNQELAETTDTLNNLLASSEIATVFLDRDLCIRWFSPSSKDLLDLVDTDIGRPVTHFAWKVEDDDLLSDAGTVLKKLKGVDAEVASSTGRWYLRRVLPYRTHDDRIAGVIIAFIDITDRKLAMDAIDEARRFAESIIETVRHPVLVLDGELRVQSINPAFCEAFNCAVEDSQDFLLHELDHGAWDIAELRQLLREVLTEGQSFEGFEIEHSFPKRGRRNMLLNARKLGRRADQKELILLAIEDVTERHDADALRQTLIGELSHRVKNMLAMVQSIGTQTLRQSSSLDEFKVAFEGRLSSLARVHELLVAENWGGADLDSLVRGTLVPHGMDERIHVDGPSLLIAPEAGVAISMILNELATNSVKYGSLSGSHGKLNVAWRLDQSESEKLINLEWIETGGPPVTPPQRSGFGSKLIERATTHQLGGTATQDFRAEGLHCRVVFPWRETARSSLVTD